MAVWTNQLQVGQIIMCWISVFVMYLKHFLFRVPTTLALCSSDREETNFKPPDGNDFIAQTAPCVFDTSAVFIRACTATGFLI